MAMRFLPGRMEGESARLTNGAGAGTFDLEIHERRGQRIHTARLFGATMTEVEAFALEILEEVRKERARMGLKEEGGAR